jgi:phosphoserine phosphatase
MGFKVVVFDLDGVLVEEPSAWWTLHHAFSTYEASKENLNAYNRGIIDYPEFMRRDISLWGSRNIEEIGAILLKGTSNNYQFVAPAQAGVQGCQMLMDSCFRRNDIFRSSL